MLSENKNVLMSTVGGQLKVIGKEQNAKKLTLLEGPKDEKENEFRYLLKTLGDCFDFPTQGKHRLQKDTSVDHC